jgi:4-hydroxy-2-oxoheptanedioate aldolase
MLHPVKRLWAEDRPVINGWLAIPDSFSAEIMGAQGYDSITIDMQHGLIGYQAAASMLQALRSSPVTPMARVPWLEPGIIMKSLDAGALGIICPMINNREEAARLASCMRYPPDGQRSFGPIGAMAAYGADYGDKANEAVVCFAMIETAEGLRNAAEIAAAPGIDGLYIGPVDLTLGLYGRKFRSGFDREEPEMLEAIKAILSAAHEAGKRAALHCGTPAYAAKAIEWGFDLVTISSDVRLMAGAAKASVDEVRSLVSASK